MTPSPAPTDDRAVEVKGQINKRLTLNLLIQGAAAHTFTTTSHLVREDLDAIHPGLTDLHDRFAISGMLNYSIGDLGLSFGRPNRWWGFSKTPQKIFETHKLMATYGNRLATEEFRHLRRLGWNKRVIPIPVLHWFQFVWLLGRVMWIERQHKSRLTQLARRAASTVWGIPENRLNGSITQNVVFGNLQTDRTMLARMYRSGVVGYGGVQSRAGRMSVVAKAWVFPLLIHELVKGTMELICLHGLNELDDDVYAIVTEEADRIEYETWLLQAGPAMWRRLIAVASRDTPLANTIMRLAKLDPQALEDLMILVIEHPEQASEALRELNRDDT